MHRFYKKNKLAHLLLSCNFVILPLILIPFGICTLFVQLYTNVDRKYFAHDRRIVLFRKIGCL